MKIDPGIATIIGAIIAAIATFVVAKINKGNKKRKMLKKAKGSIDKPETGQAVQRTIACSGKASIDDSEGEVIFLLAVEAVGLIWPKNAAVVPDASKQWTATIREEGSSDSFTVSLWAVTPQGAKEIQAWFDRGRATNDYSGLSMLPGARRLAAVSGLHLGG